MRVINARNVNDALLKGIDLFQSDVNYRVQKSRNGTTYEALEPITTVYSKPWERVCLIEERDANPFFHFIESLWMLAGRNDLEPLTYFVKSMEDFSDDGETLWGAYGHRWLHHFKWDQLDVIVFSLRNNPDDRRCVLQMWDANEDLGRASSKDLPCNTHIYFKIRDNKLNMTVCCRSNDMLWGAYGANVVHMSVLQEYVATLVGVEIGEYRQVSDSFHIYLNPVWDKVKHLEIDPYNYETYLNPYQSLFNKYKYTPLITEPEVFEWELKRFFTIHPNDFDHHFDGWANPAFKDIAVPMMRAYALHKKKKFSVYKALDDIKPVDWKIACFDWIRKRDKVYNNKADKEDS